PDLDADRVYRGPGLRPLGIARNRTGRPRLTAVDSMSSALVVLIIIALVLAVVGVGVYLSQVYNSLVTLRHDVDQAWSNIDVLTQQRRDEVSELVEAIRAAGGEPGLAPASDDRYSADTLGLAGAVGPVDAARFDDEQRISENASRLLDLAAHLPTSPSNE